MIELTQAQREELRAAVPRVIDPQTQRIYVLVSEEAYERLQSLLTPERLPMTEQRALLHAAGVRAGWDDPEMAVYDQEEAIPDKP